MKEHQKWNLKNGAVAVVGMAAGKLSGAMGECPLERGAVGEALENGAINRTTRRAAGVTRPTRHHIFLQAWRQWFAERGVDIDKFTVILDQGTHEALHYGGGPGKGGGWWNEQIMKTLTEREAALGRKLTPQEIVGVGKEMMSRAKISDLPIVPYKEAP
jgi:hypothetical protein